MDMGPYPQPGVGPPVTGMNMPQHGVNFNFCVFWKSIACKINLAGNSYLNRHMKRIQNNFEKNTFKDPSLQILHK